MSENKPNELSEKELEQAAGGTSRREIASDPRKRSRAAGQLGTEEVQKDGPTRDDVRADRLK